MPDDIDIVRDSGVASAPTTWEGKHTSPSNATGLRPGRGATIYDVASAAGVSHQTVSRFLKGYAGIRPATRERVVAALEALDYRPNLTARSLTTGRSHRIGALTHEIDQFGPGKIVQGASAAAREAGYMLDIVALDAGDQGSIAEALELVKQHDLAGVLALASTDEMTAALESTDFRVPAFIGVERDDDPPMQVSELTSVGFPALFRHLMELGHRRVVHVAGPPTWSAARNRLRAYQSLVEEHEMVSDGVFQGDWSARSGYEVMRQVVGDLDATAVVAANDQMALGAMRALTEGGLRVPEDVSVTGVDDLAEAALFGPPLTTLRVDFTAQGQAAVAQLLARIDGVEPDRSASLQCTLVVRRSTGPAPWVTSRASRRHSTPMTLSPLNAPDGPAGAVDPTAHGPSAIAVTPLAAAPTPTVAPD